MQEPGDDGGGPDFASATVDSIKRRYMVEPDFSAVSDAPGASWVDVRVRNFARGRVLQNWLEEVVVASWRGLESKFERVVTSFRDKDDRAQTWGNFEAYLLVSATNEAQTVIRRLCAERKRLSEAPERQPRVVDDPARRAVVLRALERLNLVDQHLIRRRLIEQAELEAIAEELGMTVPTMYTRLYRAKLQLETCQVQEIVETRLMNDPQAARRYAPIVQRRCQEAKPCHLYRLNCPKAWAPDGVSQHPELEEEFASYVKEALAEDGISSMLERCAWAR